MSKVSNSSHEERSPKCSQKRNVSYVLQKKAKSVFKSFKIAETILFWMPYLIDRISSTCNCYGVLLIVLVIS